MRKELQATLDDNLVIIKKAAKKMDFDNMWECLPLFYVFKELHFFLSKVYEFDEYRMQALLTLEYPLFVLADYYRDIEDEDTTFAELVDYAVTEIKSGVYLYRTDWQTLANALKN